MTQALQAVETTPQDGGPVAASPFSRRRRHLVFALLAGIVLVYAAATVTSMRQTSATFDEILFPAAGARGYTTGDWELIQFYHPRLMSYIYALPVVAADVQYPAVSDVWNQRGGAFPYAQELFFRHGNDGPAMILRVRLIAVAFAVALILLVFGYTRTVAGDVAAVFAAGSVAFLPDLLAHGGIAYNDVPAALAVLAAVLAIDRAARLPSVVTVAVASLLTGLALATKYSALSLGPIAVIILAAEACARRGAWRSYIGEVARLVPVAAVLTYLVLVAVYLGDFGLTSLRHGVAFNIEHLSGHGGVPAWLLGTASVDGFWYFFPVAFLIKTPAAFHVLALAGLAGLFVSRAGRRSSIAVLDSPLRGPVVALVVITVFLLASGLNIGFRHALPALPLLVVVVAAGIARLWAVSAPRVRVVLGVLLVAHAASTLSWFPHFIPYTSEYFHPRDLGLARLTDSSHDWGQGLPLLRRFMDEEGESVVYLSYFGSALPEAYGIDYIPLRSFFALPGAPPADAQPRFIAISATNLVGGYVGDAFAHLRQRVPYRVLGHSMFIFAVEEES
jgi:hypothetical protein